MCISNLIESAFATIRYRAKRSKGYLICDGMLVDNIYDANVPSKT